VGFELVSRESKAENQNISIEELCSLISVPKPVLQRHLIHRTQGSFAGLE